MLSSTVVALFCSPLLQFTAVLRAPVPPHPCQHLLFSSANSLPNGCEEVSFPND